MRREPDDLIRRFSEIDWFSAAGTPEGRPEAEKALNEFKQHLLIEGEQLNWISKKQFSLVIGDQTIETNPLWIRLTKILGEIKEKARKTGRLEAVAYATDDVPEEVFHRVFDRAFDEFAEYGVSRVKTAVAMTMLIVGLACSWEVIADLEGWGTNPFIPLIEVYEYGHCPIGFYDNQFYLI